MSSAHAALRTDLTPGRISRWLATVRIDLKREEPRADVTLDWSYAGGRAIVYATGDIWAAYRAVRRMLPEHDLAQKRYYGRLWTGANRTLVEPT